MNALTIDAAAIAPAASIRLADDQTAAVRVGFSRDEVLQALGKPHSRVSRVTQARTVTPN